MTDSREGGSRPAQQPEAGHQHGRERVQQSQPSFGPEEAEAIAAAQDDAVEEGLLPPSRDESGPDS